MQQNSEKALLSALKVWIELYDKPMKVICMMVMVVVENLHRINSKIMLYSMK